MIKNITINYNEKLIMILHIFFYYIFHNVIKLQLYLLQLQLLNTQEFIANSYHMLKFY